MKKNYITPNILVAPVRLKTSVLAGSLGNGDAPRSETLHDLSETEDREGNLGRNFFIQPHSVWDE